MTFPATAPEAGELLNMEPFRHLYVHLPFCRHKCGYCDFNAYAGLDGLMQPYAEALERELGYASARFPFGPMVTVYFGGGTPSLMPSESIRSLLQSIRVRFGILPEAEVTLEANPASTDAEKLASWLEAGVNRLSIGVQGFDPRALAVLERRTDGAQARRAVRQAREAGFANLSLDLIYGVPFQTVESWRATLRQAIELEPEHLSCYCLTFEEGTPLHRRLQKGLLPAFDADEQWEFMATCRSELIGAGYRRYEVSSWSRPGFESKHNQSYWKCRSVYGAGCGAHSYARFEDSSRRWWNLARPQAYISSAGFVEDGETLDPPQTAAERLMLGLRMADGLEQPAGFEAALADLEAAGLVVTSDGRVQPTERGLDLHNQVALAVL
jgi:putative oxygen-independent coproporphyrinogen III oxidase